jgi:hypothetical protein
MTHPHEDHYRGMSRLVDHFHIKAFWTFCDTFPDDFEAIIHYFQTEAHDLGGRAEVRFRAEELRKIFERVNRPEVPTLAARSNQRLYPVPAGIDDPLEIHAIAPSHRGARDYVRSVLGFLKRRVDGAPTARLFEHRHHNQVSIALLVSYGTTRIILGGDVERAGWSAVLEGFAPEFLAADVVKVSHHGSTTGYCPELWSIIGRGKRSLAVLTPYLRHRLPEPSALDEISGSAGTIYCASAAGLHPGVRDWQSQRSPSRRLEAFRSKARAALQAARGEPSTGIEEYGRAAARRLTQPRNPENAGFGHCEIRAFPDGRCEVLTHGDAMVLASSQPVEAGP